MKMRLMINGLEWIGFTMSFIKNVHLIQMRMDSDIIRIFVDRDGLNLEKFAQLY